MPATTITLAALTPVKLYDVIRGITAGGSRAYPGLAHGNGCQYLRIEPVAGITNIGDASDVSATNRGAVLDIAVPAEVYERESANGYNNIPLGIWLQSVAGSTVNVTFQYA